eukprot:9354101-Pyramimonas_sp.AAC.1
MFERRAAVRVPSFVDEEQQQMEEAASSSSTRRGKPRRGSNVRSSSSASVDSSCSSRRRRNHQDVLQWLYGNKCILLLLAALLLMTLTSFFVASPRNVSEGGGAGETTMKSRVDKYDRVDSSSSSMLESPQTSTMTTITEEWLAPPLLTIGVDSAYNRAEYRQMRTHTHALPLAPAGIYNNNQ